MVWFTKTCEDCKDEFQTTSKRMVLCRRCRRKPEHQSAASRRYYQTIRPKEAPLLGGREKARCQHCGGEYWRVWHTQKYCSEKCAQDAARKTNKPKCVACGKETISESGYCRKCKPKPPQKKEVFQKECPQCKAAFQTTNRLKVYCSDKCASKSRDLRKRECNKEPIACAKCGKLFLPRRVGNIYCSARCKRRGRSRSDNKLRHRMRKFGTKDRDNGITISALIKRYHGRCHICGGKVNTKDCSRDERGFFITGGDYPTIDHILPLSKGGGHTWNNVALAHQRCNSIKSDNPNYETATGQMKMAI